MAKAIAFINFKGGVGKTAATVNLGACLAYYRRKNVLIVDLDAQCNASFWLMPPGEWKSHIEGGKRSSYQLLRDHMMGTNIFELDKSVLFGMPRKEVPLIAKLDLLPGAVELISIEDSIHQGRQPRYFEYLSKTLKPHYKNYDYILFDCPPNTYSITKNALFAADHCVVPYLPDFLSLSGFQILARLVNDFNESVSALKGVKHKANIAAVMVSHFRQNLRDQERSIAELGVTLSMLKQDGLVHPKAKVLEPYIRFNVDVAESTNQHLPVCLHSPNSIGAQDYHALAKAFDEHFSSLP